MQQLGGDFRMGWRLGGRMLHESRLKDRITSCSKFERMEKSDRKEVREAEK